MSCSMDPKLQFIVVGSEASGKSSACNKLVGKIEFDNTVTTEHIYHSQAIIGGRVWLVTDTPGWDSDCSPDEPLKILQKAFLSAHQSLVVLLTIPIIQNRKINQEEVQRLLNALQLFDSEIWSQTIILFTKADLLDPTGIEGYLQHNGEPMQKLLDLCGHRYQTFSIYQGQQQVIDLLKKVDRMLEGNQGSTLQVAVNYNLNLWRTKEKDCESKKLEDVESDKENELSQNQETEHHVQCAEIETYHSVKPKMEMKNVHQSEAGAIFGSEYTNETFSSKPDREDNVDQFNQSNTKSTRDPKQGYDTDCKYITHPVYQQTHKQVKNSDLLQVFQNKVLNILKIQNFGATANFSSINTCCHDAVRIHVVVCGGIWNPLAPPPCIWFLICFDEADLVLLLVLNLIVFFYFTGKNFKEPPAVKQEDDQITNPSHPVGSETQDESDTINTDGQEPVQVTSSDTPMGLERGVYECKVMTDGDENSKSLETGTVLKMPEKTMGGGHEDIPKNNKTRAKEPDGDDCRVKTEDMAVNTSNKKTSKRRRRRRIRDVKNMKGDLKKQGRGRSHADGSAVEEPIARVRQESRSSDADDKAIRAEKNHSRDSDHRATQRGRRPERGTVLNRELKKQSRGRSHADGSALEESIERARQESPSSHADVKAICAGENHLRDSDHRATQRGRRPERDTVLNHAADRTELEAEALRERERDGSLGHFIDFSSTGERKRAPDHRKRQRGSSQEHLVLLKSDRKSDDVSDVTEVKCGGSRKLRRSRSMERVVKFTSSRDEIQLKVDRDRQKTEHVGDRKSEDVSDVTEVKCGGSRKLRRNRSMERVVKFTSSRDEIQLKIDRDRQKTDHVCFESWIRDLFLPQLPVAVSPFVMATAPKKKLKECGAPSLLAHCTAAYRNPLLVL